MTDLVCPRCAATVAEPDLFAHHYRCPRHGDVPGLVPARDFHADHVAGLLPRSDVPIWYPQPMPGRWVLSGLRWAQSPRRRVAAVAVGASGRGLAHGPTDVIIVAEQPGCGLGARYAGLEAVDPGPQLLAGPPAARIRAGQTATALWPVSAGRDRVAMVGEAAGNWLWFIGWPESAWGMVDDGLRLADARTDASYAVFPVGARNPRLG